MTYLVVTGHRPDKLGGYSLETMKRLGAFARLVIPRAVTMAAYCPAGRERCGNCFGGCCCEYASLHTRVLTGMARGWDQAVAAACADLGQPFEACIPFVGQEARWPEFARKAYGVLLRRADKVHTLQDTPKDNHQATIWLHGRNVFMLDRAKAFSPTMPQPLLALWDGSGGGTASTVRAARTMNFQVMNVWPLWGRFLAGKLASSDMRLTVEP